MTINVGVEFQVILWYDFKHKLIQGRQKALQVSNKQYK